eukprot:6195747-Pleurochrysis_carterae.AAC.1
MCSEWQHRRGRLSPPLALMAAHSPGLATHWHAGALRHRWRLYRVTVMTHRDATLSTVTLNELVI